ncbi:rhomboid family intramembrane serine protease [Thiospirochaeta perfilievii]|uniref:Rhomboid family intramembrane serine protease n=1 Tax=Thiospirochaeta perfilievii TaxID=252967 RepID=A0A5C1Q930_9SPIO|nr:rhomboid family intramembrane serine protease [Thiospirochaeta perfilievii]QEN03947.1 rhomboid family intramembrane serine protease [Thiospirochaeta perfilievii]
MKIRIKYNAPVSLTLIILSSLVLFLNTHVNPYLISNWFTADGSISFKYSDPYCYLKFISHILGHTDMGHFMGNAIYLILLGPILEEKYKSTTLLGLILITAIISSGINALALDTYMLGASGIVYLFIVLISFTNIEKGEFPLSVVVVLGFYIYKEISREDAGNISVVTHFVGAAVGLLYGLITVMGGFKPSFNNKKDISTQDTVIR